MSHTDIEDFWENAPSGHLITYPDGRIIRVNSTFAQWVGYERGDLSGRALVDLLSVGGRLHYETHFRPLLGMSGELNGVTVDLVTADGTRLPVFLTANVRRGADGQPKLLRITAVDAADRRSYERELMAQRRRAEKERSRVQAFADTLRRSLSPPVLSPPPGLDAAAYYHTASEDDVGGDFYDLFPLSSSSWGFFLGDVAGKGVDAAVVTGLTRYVLRSAAVSDGDPVKVLHTLNAVVMQELDIDRHRLCTVIYGRLTERGDGFDVEIASGGHPPPLLLDGEGDAYYADTTGGQAVGLSKEPHFVDCRFALSPGDTLMLYTDGLSEADAGPGRRCFDSDGALLRFAKALAPSPASEAVDAVRDLLDELGAGVQDDSAILALGVPH